MRFLFKNLIAVAIFLAAPTICLAQSALERLGAATPSDIKNLGGLPELTGTIVTGVLGMSGVILIALIVYAGIIWGTAAGDDAKVKKAKSIITAAVTGLVIALIAFAITSFLLQIFGI